MLSLFFNISSNVEQFFETPCRFLPLYTCMFKKIEKKHFSPRTSFGSFRSEPLTPPPPPPLQDIQDLNSDISDIRACYMPGFCSATSSVGD